jgi:membrane-bound lytic murein transglycosylase B
MTHRLFLLAPLAIALIGLAACMTTPAAPAEPPAFVEAACGGCHAVEPPFLSPNARAPSFESVANRPGVTRTTIQAWLRNAHNYPEIMDFDLTPEHVDEVSGYMITLRRRDYVPVE